MYHCDLIVISIIVSTSALWTPLNLSHPINSIETQGSPSLFSWLCPLRLYPSPSGFDYGKQFGSGARSRPALGGFARTITAETEKETDPPKIILRPRRDNLQNIFYSFTRFGMTHFIYIWCNFFLLQGSFISYYNKKPFY